MKPEGYNRLDDVPCDYCGERIERGCTILHTGQIVHHDCSDEAVEFFNDRGER